MTRAPAFEVAPAAQIEQRGQPGGAKREPDDAVAPGAPDAVAHHHRAATSKRSCKASRSAALLASGSCGSSSTRSPSSAARHVGVIDAGIRDDHAQAMLRDDEAGAKTQDLAGFGEDHLHQRRVLARGGRELRARGDGVTSASVT